MKCLITGSRGAAAWYLEQVLDDWHGLARPECDLLDFDAVCERLDEIRPDVVYHLASDADVRASFDFAVQTIRNNVEGTVNLFEACRHVGVKPHMVICSSSEVYGNPGRWPIMEDFPLAPVNPYAVSKATQDLLGGMYAACYDFPVVRTRAFGYINPRRPDLSLSSFARQISEIEKGKRLVLRHGNLDSIRTFCDVRDVASAYVMAAELTGVFNIGEETPYTVGDCLEIMCEMSTAQIRRDPDPALWRPSDVTHQIPDCSRFRAVTGWRAQIPLHESLKWLLDYYRAEAMT